jgi:hypothetical protein
MARRTIFGLVAVLALLVFALPALGAPLTAFRLVPMIGWERLEQVNPYATIDSDYVTELASPMAGLRNAEASVVQITARARVDLDTSETEISADFIPVSGEIVQVGSRLFAAPIGRQLKGTIVLTVRNPNDFPMESARVEGSVGSVFQPTVTGRSQGNAGIEGNDPRGISQPDSLFVWDVGSLLPNEAARCEISVTTRRNSSGGFGFSKEGSYTIDSGFLLTCTMRGKTQRQRTSPHSIIAHKNPEGFGLNAGSSHVAINPFEREWTYPERTFPERSSPIGPVPGDLSKGGKKPAEEPQASTSLGALVRQLAEPVQIERVHKDDGGNETELSRLFRLTATGISENIGVEDDKFTVPSGEEAEWIIELWVNCPVDWSAPKAQSEAQPAGQPGVQPQDQPEGWNGWIVTLLLGEHLTAEEIEKFVVVPGHPDIQEGILTIEVTYPEPGITRVKIIWDWHQTAGYRFLPGSYACLALKVTTDGLPPSDKDSIFCDHINMEYNPVGSGYWHQVPLDPIYIKSTGEPYADVSVTATRLDWRVQKPGTYAALATKITASGIGRLSIQFSEFENLSKVGGTSGTIAASYGFGDNLAAAEAAGWISAVDLNNEVRYIDLSEPVPVSMWSKISVGDGVSSAEYESTGVITFIVSNN